jgi:hypothetical protein
MSEGGEYMSEKVKYCPLNKAYSGKLTEVYAKVMNEELDKAMEVSNKKQIVPITQSTGPIQLNIFS